jgi:probable selenium-dependent hydroxylase accessory protein YqeC
VEGNTFPGLREIELPAGPVSAARANVVGVVLAAGRAVRFGRNKLVEPFHGKPLVRRVVEAALASRLSSVTVVLGHDRDAVCNALAALTDSPQLNFTINPSYGDGQSTSVIAGLASVPAHSAGAMFLVGDQPFVGHDVIDSLIDAFEAAGGGICYPTCNGRRCNPVIFDARFFPALRQLRGDGGGRAIIDAHREAAIAVDFPDPATFADIDHPADVGRLLLGRAGPRPAKAASLMQALGLQTSRLISICGSGGKTSLMSALVRELAADRSERILATTTTKLAADEMHGPWRPVQAACAADILLTTTETVGPFLAYRHFDSDRCRLHGFPPDVVDELAASGRFTRIIVEADGARRLPLKAPCEGEPVFPTATDAVVAVAGLSGLGGALSEDVVFRPDRWTFLTGLPSRGTVTAEQLARVIVHPDGLMRGAQAQARRAVFLNQAELPGCAAQAAVVLAMLPRLSGCIPERAVAGQLRPQPLIHAAREFDAPAPPVLGGERCMPWKRAAGRD